MVSNQMTGVLDWLIKIFLYLSFVCLFYQYLPQKIVLRVVSSI